MAVASDPVGSTTLQVPPPELRFKRRLRPLPVIAELWAGRELITSLTERELRARYKQAVLGFAWAIITPVVLMVVFSVFFTRVASINTRGIPYPIFSYMGLLPWTFFSNSVSQGGMSLVTNVNLLNKVYCPREVFPISSVLVASIDTAIALLALGALFLINLFAPRSTSFWVPALLAVQFAFTLGVTMLASVIVVHFRDLRHALPLILQFGLFATPVAYGLDAIPSSWRGLYVTLNPLASVIDGYRRTVLLGQPPQLRYLALSAAASAVFLVGGYVVFKRLEAAIADVA